MDKFKAEGLLNSLTSVIYYLGRPEDGELENILPEQYEECIEKMDELRDIIIKRTYELRRRVYDSKER
jgi:hypothetical protein